jgi:polyhydroxybutyrate depolymerase
VGNSSFTECKPSRPVSVLAMHGTSDPLVPYAYVKPSLDHMAMAAGCSMTTEPAQVPKSAGDTSCVTYTGCPAGIEITGCSVSDGGHCWFGNETCGTGDTSGIGTLIVGNNSKNFVSTDAVWDFFERLSR